MKSDFRKKILIPCFFPLPLCWLLRLKLLNWYRSHYLLKPVWRHGLVRVNVIMSQTPRCLSPLSYQIQESMMETDQTWKSVHILTQLYLGKTTQHNQKSNYLIQWIVIISYSGVSHIQPPFWLWIVVERSGGTVMKRRVINILLWVSIWCLRVSIVIPWRRRTTTRSIRWNMPSFRDFRTLTPHDRLL